MTDSNDRVDRLESLVERQAATLERQEQVISDLRETNDRLRARLDDESRTDPTVSRRDALKAGGVLAALGVGGAGTASADPQGQIGTTGDPARAIYLAALDGPVTGGQRITSLAGNGLTVDGGTLTLTGGTEMASQRVLRPGAGTERGTPDSTRCGDGLSVSRATGTFSRRCRDSQ